MIADKCPRIDVVCLALASKSLARMLPLWKHNARPAHGVQITLGSRTDTAIMFRAKVFERLKCKHSAPSIRLCVGCGLLRTTDRNFWEGELHRMQSNAAACQLEYGMNIRVDEQRRDTEEVFEGALQKWHAGLEGALCPSCVAWTHHSVMRGRG